MVFSTSSGASAAATARARLRMASVRTAVPSATARLHRLGRVHVAWPHFAHDVCVDLAQHGLRERAELPAERAQFTRVLGGANPIAQLADPLARVLEAVGG